jgi:phage-related minor tail protein
METSEFKVNGEDLLRKIRELINEGNVRRIIIKDETGKVFIEIPVTLGLIGAVIAPILAAVGALAALAANFTIEVIRREN